MGLVAAGINTIPERLVAYRAYKDGTDLIGVVDVELPKIEYITDTLKGAGILGELETPTIGQTKSLKTKITFRTPTIGMMGLLACVGHDIEFRQAIQNYDAGSGERNYNADRVVIRGFPVTGELGKLESGANSNNAVELETVYLKYEINGKVVLEIDKLNCINIVNGTDYLAEVRKALGMV